MNTYAGQGWAFWPIGSIRIILAKAQGSNPTSHLDQGLELRQLKFWLGSNAQLQTEARGPSPSGQLYVGTNVQAIIISKLRSTAGREDSLIVGSRAIL